MLSNKFNQSLNLKANKTNSKYLFAIDYRWAPQQAYVLTLELSSALKIWLKSVLDNFLEVKGRALRLHLSSLAEEKDL